MCHRLDPVREILFSDGPGLRSLNFLRFGGVDFDRFGHRRTLSLLEFMSVANVGSFAAFGGRFLLKVAMLDFFALGFSSVEFEEFRAR